MTIGAATIAKIADQIHQHMVDYNIKIDRAYSEAEELSISFSAKLSPDKNGVKVQTSISFVESRVKDSETCVVEEA